MRVTTPDQTYYRAVVVYAHADGRETRSYIGPYVTSAGATQAKNRVIRNARRWDLDTEVSGYVEETTPEWKPKRCSACGH